MKNLFTLLFLLFALSLSAQTIPAYQGAFTLAKPGGARIDFVNSDIDQNENLYICGAFYGTVDIDPGPSTDMRTSNGFYDLFFSSFDKNGNLRWCLSGGSSIDETITHIKVDKDGTVLILGLSNNAVDLDMGSGTNYATGNFNSFVARYDTSGNLLWAHNTAMNVITSVFETGSDFTIDSSGNLIFSTIFFGVTDFNLDSIAVDTLQTLTADGDIAIVKYDSEMNFIWAKHLQGANDGRETANCIAIDTADNIIIAGTLSANNAVDFNPDSALTQIVSGTAFKNMYTAKFDSAGNYIWTTLGTGYEVPRRLAVDKYGNSLIVFQSNTVASAMASYTSSGILINKFELNSPDLCDIYDIKFKNDTTIYVCGFLTDSLDVDPGPGTHYLYADGPLGSMYVSEYTINFDFIWAANVQWFNNVAGLSTGYSISTYENGFYVAGNLKGTIDADPSAAVDSLTGDNTYWGGFVLHFKDAAISRVYPGDTDSSGTVDNYDLLPIGLHYGETGYARKSISNSWSTQQGTQWELPTQITHINRAHADCNGNGVVNNDDTLAVNLNYGQVRGNRNLIQSSLDPELKIDFEKPAYSAGDTVRATVSCGSALNPVTAIMGIGIQFEIPADYIKTGSLNFTPDQSWICNGNNCLNINHETNNRIEFSMIRTDHVNVNGDGVIGTIEFVQKALTTPAQNFILQPLNYMAVDNNGNQLLFYIVSDSAMLTGTVGLNENNLDEIILSPNPAHDKISVSINKNNSEKIIIRISDLQGRELLSQQKTNSNPIDISIATLKPGVYILKAEQNDKIILRKFIKQ